MMDPDVRKAMEVLLRHAGYYEAKEADIPQLWNTLYASIEAFMSTRANQHNLESEATPWKTKKKKTPGAFDRKKSKDLTTLGKPPTCLLPHLPESEHNHNQHPHRLNPFLRLQNLPESEHEHNHNHHSHRQVPFQRLRKIDRLCSYRVAGNAVKTRSCQAVEQRMIIVLLYLSNY
jgi:hypothetical protein